MGEDRGNEVLALEDGGGDVPAADRVVARGVMNGGIVIRGGAGRGVAAAAGVGIVGEIVTGTGIAIIGVTAVNVTFVEIGMVLLVMEALLPISEDDSIMAPRPLASFLPPAVAPTLITSPHSLIVVPEAVPRGGMTVRQACPFWCEMFLPM